MFGWRKWYDREKRIVVTHEDGKQQITQIGELDGNAEKETSHG